MRFDDARRLRQRALEIYRAKYGLLSADEIRAIRERFGLNVMPEVYRKLVDCCGKDVLIIVRSPSGTPHSDIE